MPYIFIIIFTPNPLCPLVLLLRRRNDNMTREHIKVSVTFICILIQYVLQISSRVSMYIAISSTIKYK